jgi:hypothetical protein
LWHAGEEEVLFGKREGRRREEDNIKNNLVIRETEIGRRGWD